MQMKQDCSSKHFQTNLVEKSKKNPGLKYFKERLTVLCASDNGEKLKAIVMSKTWKPYCFKNLKTKNGINYTNLPVIFKANTKSWMTSFIFED